MKEFSILNGYAVKDAAARETIKELCTTPQQFGAAADGITDDTAAIQAALDTGRDVYFPNGTYLVTGAGLTINTENQAINFEGDAWIEAKNITAGYVLLVNSMYNKLNNVKIRLNDNAEKINGIQLGGLAEDPIPDTSYNLNKTSTSLTFAEEYLYGVSVSASYSNVEVQCIADGLQDYLTKNNWGKHPNIYITVTPTNGAEYKFGVSGNLTVCNVKKTFTYEEFAAIATTGTARAMFQFANGGSYLIDVTVGTIPADISADGGFTCHLNEVTVTGKGLCGLQVYGPEARVLGGKFRGTRYGINIEAPDFYGENIYTEQCTDTGFRARSGSIEAHHIHSYNNANKGFNLAGINYSNFYGLYADKNIGDGVYMADNSGEVNIYGGWSFYSGYEREDQSVYDWNFSNVKDLNLFGSRSSGGDETKVASYNVDAKSRVYFYGCMANISPKIAAGGIARFMNCGDALRTYNTGSKSYKGEKIKIASGSTVETAIYLDEILNETHDIMSFNCVVQYRGTNTYTSGLEKHILQLSAHYENKLVSVIEDEKVTITVKEVEFAENGSTKATFNVVNNSDEELQINVTLTKMGSIY